MVPLSYFPLENRTPLTYLSFSIDFFKAFKNFLKADNYWIEGCQDIVWSKMDITMATINEKLNWVKDEFVR